MTNDQILREDFILLKNYKRIANSETHIDSIIKCNSTANIIGAIDEITITESDNVVIVRLAVDYSDDDCNLRPVITFEIREYNRKIIDHGDGESINTDRP